MFLPVKMKALSQKHTGSKSSVKAKIVLPLNSLCSGGVPLAPGAHGFAICVQVRPREVAVKLKRYQQK